MATLLTTSYQKISTISLSYGEIRTYAKYSNQSIGSNTTTYELKSTYYTSQNTLSFSSATGVLDGTTRNYGYTTMYKGETTISEVSRTITHNSDGSSPTKNVATSWTASYGGSGNTSADVTFPKLNRYATITSAPDFNDEANPTINYSNPAGNSVTTLQAGIFAVDNSVAYASYRDISKTGSSYTFNLTTAERNVLRNATPNSNTLSVKFGIKTVTGGVTFYSENTKTMTIVNGNPTFTHSELETNTTVSNALGSTSASTIVKNLSRVKFTITPSAKKGSSIKKVELTHSGTTYSDTTSPYEFTVTPLANSFVAKVTDSRGNTSSTTITKTLINYEPVKILSFSFKRQNPTSSNIILNLEATYWNSTVGSVTNAPVVKWKMDNGSQTTIPSSSVTIDNTNHKITISNYTLSDQLVYTSGATFYIYVNDAFSSASNNTNVTKGIPVLDLGDNEAIVNGTLESTGDFNTPNLNLFNDTSGSDWQAMMKNKIDYCISNIDTTKNNKETFINGGWSGVNYGFGVFSKIGTTYQLVWHSQIGTLYCRKIGSTYVYGRERSETQLYNNTSGSTGTITLSESAGSFEYIEIFYGKATGNGTGLASVKVPRPISAYANLICWSNLGSVPQLLTKIAYINGTSISHQAGYYLNFSSNSVSTGSNNEVKIYRVVGYR